MEWVVRGLREGGYVHGVVGGQVAPVVGHGMHYGAPGLPGATAYGPPIPGGLGSNAWGYGPQSNVNAQQRTMADLSAVSITLIFYSVGFKFQRSMLFFSW